MQSTEDLDTAQRYSRTQRAFGGLFFRGDTLVVLFTADVDGHRATLTRLLLHPDQLEVRAVDRTWDEMLSAQTRVEQLVMTDFAAPVTAVGLTVMENRFVVQVGLSPYSDEAANAISDRVAPEQVLVTEQPTAVRL